MIELFWCDGTWAGRGGSPASEALRRSLRPSVKFTYVSYPGMFGPATGAHHMSAAESIEAGARTMAAAVHASRYPAIVGGYSQGAMVAYRFARAILPKRPELDVRAVAAMGNPHEPTHQGNRGGIAERGWQPRKLLSVWAPGDPIADLVGSAPLRSAWDATEWMSVRDFNSALRWVNDLTNNVTDGPGVWWQNPDVLASLRAANAYLFGTQHTTDYARFGHATRLARQIEAMVP
ncbi:PE-PPE domain-containing protein [Gordonia hongkongensis]|uniref:PE-PPE domain-containing protein n=1 Tax=Gordonia hongkongensis TaxID=1701090 RepID=UPI003D738F79